MSLSAESSGRSYFPKSISKFQQQRSELFTDFRFLNFSEISNSRAFMAASASAWEEEEDEWELCNDDGFVYKRRKRRKRDEDDSTTTTGAVVDQEAEIRRRKRTHRKKTLLKLKEQYNKEFVQWEHLSNTLREMEERTQNHHQQQLQLQASSSSTVISQRGDVIESSSQRLVDDLLLQAEAQVAVIQDISSLCDVVEAMCMAEEEHLKKSFFDLPIWGSPRSLLASLCDQDNNDDV